MMANRDRRLRIALGPRLGLAKGTHARGCWMLASERDRQFPEAAFMDVNTPRPISCSVATHRNTLATVARMASQRLLLLPDFARFCSGLARQFGSRLNRDVLAHTPVPEVGDFARPILQSLPDLVHATLLAHATFPEVE